MGGDGGVVANCRKFIRGCEKEEVKDGKNIKRQQQRRARTCAQSQEKLVEPIVACEMGNLYKKEALLEAILEKSLNASFSHVRNMRDVKEIKTTKNPAYVSSSGGFDEESISEFMCPVTLLEFSGLHPFVVIWTTGFLLAEKAIREVGIEALQEEYGPFTEADVVHILPLESDLLEQSRQMDNRFKLVIPTPAPIFLAITSNQFLNYQYH